MIAVRPEIESVSIEEAPPGWQQANGRCNLQGLLLRKHSLYLLNS
jgi:hypothetical protein